MMCLQDWVFIKQNLETCKKVTWGNGTMGCLMVWVYICTKTNPHFWDSFKQIASTVQDFCFTMESISQLVLILMFN
jgi:hypothetical protein